MIRGLVLIPILILCMWAQIVLLFPICGEAATARAARDTSEQKRAVSASVAYIRANALQPPIVSVSGGISLTVHVEKDWFSVSNQLKTAFADRINDLALVGNGGIAIPIEILVGGRRVAVSVYTGGVQSMRVL